MTSTEMVYGTKQLLVDEIRRFEECEAVIERGLQTFVDVGLALAEIRDSKLYRQEYGTFEIYLHKRWDISKSRAYQMIESSRVTREMSTIVDAAVLPQTESQARELVGLDKEQAALVMSETANRVRGKVTAKAIRQTRERIIYPTKPEPPKPQPKPSAERDVRDEHFYCDDETRWKQEALAAWDENPDAFTLKLRFRDLLGRHIDCWDPYIMAGQWASWLDSERDAPGAEVLAALAVEIGMFFYREIEEMLGHEPAGVNGGDD